MGEGLGKTAAVKAKTKVGVQSQRYTRMCFPPTSMGNNFVSSNVYVLKCMDLPAHNSECILKGIHLSLAIRTVEVCCHSTRMF